MDSSLISQSVGHIYRNRYWIYGAILVWFLYKLSKWMIHRIEFARKVNKIPQLPIRSRLLFFLGHLDYINISFGRFDILEVYFQVLNCLTKLYTDSSFVVWIVYKPFIFVHRADEAEKILSSNTIVNKSGEYNVLEPWLNTGLLTSNGKKWRQRRKLLTPAFHFNILDEFRLVMNEQAKILVEVIQKRNTETDSGYLNSVPLYVNLALDVIAETAMGLKIGSLNNQNQHYVNAISRVTAAALKRMIYEWLRNDWIYLLLAEGRQHRRDLDLVHKFTMDVIQKRKQEMLNRNVPEAAGIEPADSSNSKRRLAFLDLLLKQHIEQPDSFTLADVQEEVDTFMFEGHDTTAMSMIWTTMLLGNHPKIQERVHEEIDAIRSENSDESLDWTADQLRRMKLLEACIKEALRLYPSVPMISRIAEEDLMLKEKNPTVIVPREASMVLLLYCIQRDPKYFREPERFIPDRFMEDSDYYDGKQNPFAYVPFSAGPRNCIGQKFALQEEKIILATVLSKFRVESRLPVDRNPFVSELILRPKAEIDIRFVPR